ncbi:MAG: ribonuclease E inhibitor RraB [Solirubrobacteraceae bacterium]|nr:ribonuclease E inhibitor RraB [Solirubrobacteraceae bacterium]
MAVPGWFEETVARQAAMTPQTWAVLQEHGVDSDTELKLDFFYDAPTEERATELVAFLRLETDYEVDVDFAQSAERRTWSVVGTTHPTAVTKEILQEWVRWMIAAGAEYGECRFDGWGASLPK